MTHYWYNDRVDTNNNHEVHKLSCKYLPDTIHSTYLGKFDYNFQAMEYAKYTEPEDFSNLQPKYEVDEIMYHIRQCEHSELFIDKVSYFIGGGCMVRDLSPKGHEFIANIRKDTNWNRTKSIAKDVGSFSINALTGIASQIIAELISRQFNQ